ncbi:MAG TPA: hypothetical protein VFE82_03555 [Ramlibacter sp.]|jgi:hypothetical protein|uniref:hypothetical protein n=1 Tax=Ramlibacter sp. TaxID=1917967 RepID=UPI002D2A7AFD|nr:hypothetical protein [Ramlibacter sp.]HZY17528.1 hypothetical protein [Ramlibacter sp.]
MIGLNGWRRLGLVLAGLWLVGCLALATVEWSGKQTGVFVYRTLTAGSTIDVLKNQVVLPDGSVAKLTQNLAGRQPWELDWKKEPEAAPVLVLNWLRILKLGLFFPIAVWLALEGIALCARWVLRGFPAARKEVR